MPLRKTVRKLSSNLAMDTAILVPAMDDVAIKPNMAVAIRNFFIVVSSLWMSGGTRFYPAIPTWDIVALCHKLRA